MTFLPQPSPCPVCGRSDTFCSPSLRVPTPMAESKMPELPEVVAWRYRNHGDMGWKVTTLDPTRWFSPADVVEPLYAHPPREDERAGGEWDWDLARAFVEVVMDGNAVWDDIVARGETKYGHTPTAVACVLDTVARLARARCKAPLAAAPSRGGVVGEALIVECDDCGERFDNKLANCPSCGSLVRIVQVQP